MYGQIVLYIRNSCPSVRMPQFPIINKEKLCSMTCCGILQQRKATTLTSLHLKDVKKYKVRWFISHYDFRMGCDPPPLSATGWLKNTRWFISHYDFRMGCDHSPFMEQGGSKNTRWFISDSDFRMGCDPSLFIGTQKRQTQKSLFSW